MDPEQELARLCRRTGLPYEAGVRLLPIVRRAAQASPPLRERLLGIVRAALEREAEDRSRDTRLEDEVDERCLAAVAGVLHHWDPFG